MPDMYSEQRTRLLKEKIAYDPETGLFTWKVDHCRRKAGEVAGSIKPDGYAYLKLHGQTYGAHWVAWSWSRGHGQKARLTIETVTGVTTDRQT